MPRWTNFINHSASRRVKAAFWSLKWLKFLSFNTYRYTFWYLIHIEHRLSSWIYVGMPNHNIFNTVWQIILHRKEKPVSWCGIIIIFFNFFADIKFRVWNPKLWIKFISSFARKYQKILKDIRSNSSLNETIII